jgi:putative chitinase
MFIVKALCTASAHVHREGVVHSAAFFLQPCPCFAFSSPVTRTPSHALTTSLAPPLPSFPSAPFPPVSPVRAAVLMPYVNAALAFAGATTCFRAAAFLALVSHFARGGTLFEELGTGEAHAGPVAATDPAFDKFEGVAALGNTLPGDGARFRARGAFRLRGRTDYAAAAFALGLDLLDDPEALALPSAALTVAAWQWGAQAGNAAADRCERASERASMRAGL